MSMLIQNILIAVIVLGAVAYLGWTAYRTFVGKKNCGCGSAKCAKMDDAVKKLESARKG